MYNSGRHFAVMRCWKFGDAEALLCALLTLNLVCAVYGNKLNFESHGSSV